ncbi:hypothetical protein MVES_001401 [Malassezia vespertilionis]|uniref:Protein RER1 n=1 Tax=Malassezia vespertilionis TaxID=2020962 RepID=A0A2N1JCE5_9BASI|nr:hypothetical protein MVES_001401 [Malassezia vespertilionis]
MMRAEEQGNAPHENQFSPANVMQRAHMLNMRAQHMIDSLAPFAKERWAGTGVLLFLFMLRIVFAHGWYIVCYALFIYLLNLFLAFLSPKFDPAHESDLAAQDVEDGEPGLPTSSKPGGGLMSNVFHGSSGQADADTDEFRPFIRRLPEFKVRRVSTHTRSFGSLRHKRHSHMIQYKYLPFDIGRKARYGRS